MKKFLRVSGEILIYIGLYLAAQMLLSLILGIIFGIQLASGKHPEIDPVKLQNTIQTLVDRNIFYMLSGSILVSLTALILIFKARKEDLFKICNFSVLKISNAGLAILLGIAFNWSLIVLNSITSFYKLFPDYQKLAVTLFGGGFIPTLLVIGIIVPIFEEILFRGVVFNVLRKHIPLMGAVAVQGLIFGIYHMNLLQGIYGTILGTLAALVYSWLNSLWAPICIHASFNTLSIVMDRFGKEQTINRHAPVMLLLGVVMVGLSILLLQRNRVKSIDRQLTGLF